MSPDEGAAFWVVRTESRTLSVAERQLFDEWLAVSRNAAAHASTGALYAVLGQIHRRGAYPSAFRSDSVLIPFVKPGNRP